VIIIAAGICSILPAVYLMRLMADGRKLTERLQERSIELSNGAQAREVPLIKLDYAAWTARPSCKAKAARGGRAVPFRSPGIEKIGDGGSRPQQAS